VFELAAVPTTAPASTPTSYSLAQWDQTALIQALNSMALQSNAAGTGEWVMDTGALTHMSPGAGNLQNLHPSSLHSQIIVGNGATLPVTYTASSIISSSARPLHLSNVLVAPNIIKNLLSVRALTRDNCLR